MNFPASNKKASADDRPAEGLKEPLPDTGVIGARNIDGESVPELFRFAEFVLDPVEMKLSRFGETVHLTPKEFGILLLLVGNHGRLMEKTKILDAVWSDQFVEEGVLSYNLSRIRKALGDDPKQPLFIETVPRRGYRFIEVVTPVFSRNRMEPKSEPDELAGMFLTPLVGRAKEVAELKKILARDDIRLVTLTGIGGTGKTRLAHEVADKARHLFPIATRWVDLTSVSDLELLMSAIATSLVPNSPGNSDPVNAIAGYFASNRALLVLDNFEQVLEAAPELIGILKAAPGLKMLVTSREPLKLAGEYEFKVPPLGLPPDNSRLFAEDLMEYESANFFLERASAVRHGLEIRPEDTYAIIKICRKLDGIPLALELAASRTDVLSFDEILQKLDEGPGILSTNRRDLPVRQQTMLAAIEWSIELLNGAEKAGLAALSVFEGGFTFRAAEAVLAVLSEIDGKDQVAADVISGIFDKGLIQRVGGTDELRFGMLVIIRDFVLEFAPQFIDFTAACQAHAEYFQEFAESHSTGILSASSPESLAAFKREHDNICAALRWSVENEPDLASRIAAATRHFWAIHGHMKAGRQWMESALAVSRKSNPEVRIELLTGLGNITQFQSDGRVARHYYQECLKEALEIDNKTFVSRSLRGIGATFYLESDFSSAKKHLLQAMKISTSIEDEFGIAASLARLGEIDFAEEDAEGARSKTRKALEIYYRLGYLQGIASKLANLAMFEFCCGNIEAAWESIRESTAICVDVGDEIDFRLDLEVAAAISTSRGDPHTAAVLSGFAEARCEAIDYPLEPVEQMFREFYKGQLIEIIGPSAYERGAACGRELSLEEGRSMLLALFD